MERLTPVGSATTSWPSTVAVPPSGGKKQLSIFMVVVLPAPLGPMKPSTSPLLTANETSSTATSGPKVLRSPLASIIGGSVLVGGVG